MRLPGEPLIWADAGELEILPLDWVQIRRNGSEEWGHAYACPEDMLRFPGLPDAVVLSVRRSSPPTSDSEDLPGADMPPLGSTLESDGGTGTVIGIDPVTRITTVRTESYEVREVALGPVSTSKSEGREQPVSPDPPAGQERV